MVCGIYSLGHSEAFSSLHPAGYGKELGFASLGAEFECQLTISEGPRHTASARRAERCSMHVGSTYNRYAPESKVPQFLNVSVSETTLCHPN